MKIIATLVAALAMTGALAVPARAAEKDICLSLSILGIGPIIITLGNPPDFSCLVQPDDVEPALEAEPEAARS